MRVETTRFGALDLAEERLYRLAEGLVGFPLLKRFLLIESGEGGPPFKWFQSVDEPSLAFIVLDPEWLVPGYRAELPAAAFERLGAAPGEAEALAIVTIPDDPQEMSANLKGPLLFHPGTRQGVQLVLDEERFALRHPVLPSLAKR